MFSLQNLEVHSKENNHSHIFLVSVMALIPPSPHHNAFWNPASRSWQLGTTFLGSNGLPFSNPLLTCGHCGGFHKSRFCAGIKACRVCGGTEDKSKATTVFVKDIGNHFPRHTLCHDRSSVCRVCRRETLEDEPFVMDNTSMFPRHSSCLDPLLLPREIIFMPHPPKRPTTHGGFATRTLDTLSETLPNRDSLRQRTTRRTPQKNNEGSQSPALPLPRTAPPKIGDLTEFPPLC